MAAVEHDFSKGVVWRHIVSLAIPLTVAQLVQVLYNIVDRIYIGHLPGTDGLALTGIGLTFPITVIIAAFTLLFGNGGAPLCSIARGAGENDRAEQIMGVSMAALSIFSVLIMGLAYLFKRPILYAFGASDATYYYANEYLEIYLIGTVFSMVGIGMNSYINAQGFARVGMLTTVIGAVLNIVLDPLFIFVFHMGIRGAAIATVLSQGVSFLWVLWFLLSDQAILRLKRSTVRLYWPILKQILTLGTADFIMQLTNAATQIACNKVLSIYGGDVYLGIMTVLNSVREIFGLPVTGLSNGASPVLGFNFGAKRYRRVKQGIRFASVAGLVYTAVAWAIVFLIPGPLIRIFSSDPTLVAKGIPAMHIYFFGYVFMSFQFMGQATFKSLGKAKQAIFFSIFRKIIIVVPLTILLPRLGMGVNGVFWAEPISNAIGGLACYITMLLTVWRELSREEGVEGI